MIISINQPAYLPWLGYYNRILQSDIHVVLDHVQFEKNSFVNRNKIRNSTDWMWLTVPIKSKGKFGQLQINTVEVSNEILWTKKHRECLAQNYRKTKYFEVYFEQIEPIYLKEWGSLNMLLREYNELIMKLLGIHTTLLYSSDLELSLSKSDLVLEICLKIRANTYFSGTLGKTYLDENSFTKNNIKIVYQEYVHPIYNQPYKDFYANMCILDLLFNCGTESRSIIESGFKIKL